jgi:S1-C subfamily serine protease
VPAGAVAFGAVPGTPAERAGFGRAPVVVTAVDGRQVGGTMAGWCRATSGRHSGDGASLRVVEPRTAGLARSGSSSPEPRAPRRGGARAQSGQ